MRGVLACRHSCAKCIRQEQAEPDRFGAHQYRAKRDDTIIYATWFSGGLKIVDVDDNGLIYLLDRNASLDILAFDRP